MAYSPKEVAAKRREIRRRVERKEREDREKRLLASTPSTDDLAALVATFEQREGFPK